MAAVLSAVDSDADTADASESAGMTFSVGLSHSLSRPWLFLAREPSHELFIFLFSLTLSAFLCVLCVLREIDPPPMSALMAAESRLTHSSPPYSRNLWPQTTSAPVQQQQ